MNNIILAYIIRKCTYVYVRFVTGFLSFFAPLGPFTPIVVHGISRKCAAMPQCRGLLQTLQYFPDLVGISPILLDIPSRPKCDRDRKKSRFWHLFWYFIWILMILTQEQSIPTTDIQKKNETWAPGSCSTCTLEDTSTYIGMKMTIVLSNILDRNFSLRLKMAFQESRFQCFLGEHAPTPPPPPPTPPNYSSLQHSPDSSVIEEYPDFTHSKGWTVW